MRAHLLIFCLFFPAALMAVPRSAIMLIGSSEKLMAISHPPKDMWRLNDYACLSAPKGWDRKKVYYAPCGWIIMSTNRGAVVKFTEPPDELVVGRGAFRATRNPKNALMRAEQARRTAELRHPEEMLPFYHLLLDGSPDYVGSDTQNTEAAENFEKGEVKLSTVVGRDIMLGIGFSFFRPQAIQDPAVAPTFGTHFFPSTIVGQFVVDHQTALGATAFYRTFADNQISGSNGGILANYNYYLKEVFHGFWMQWGVGLSSTSTTISRTEATYISYLGAATFGWRSKTSGRANWGVGGGAQGIYTPSTSELPNAIIQIIPYALADVTWSF